MGGPFKALDHENSIALIEMPGRTRQGAVAAFAFREELSLPARFAVMFALRDSRRAMMRCAGKSEGRALSLFAAYNLPFAVALALMVMLAISQLVGLGDMIGDADMDVDVDADANAGDLDGAGGALASLIGWGRLPLLLWLSLFLFFFAATGALVQWGLIALTAKPLSPLLAALAAVVPATFLTGLTSRPLARILPHDETSAVSRGSLVGRRGQIVTGRAKAGSPARARVLDHFNQPHHVMVEPHDATSVFEEGEAVLLVRRDGDLFYGIAVEQRFLVN